MNARPQKEPDCRGFGWGDARDVGKAALKAGLELLKAPKDNAVNAYEVLTAQNPVSNPARF
jgi:hypothetical protein